MEGVANCAARQAAYGTRATCHMAPVPAPAPCLLPHGQIARNLACKMQKIFLLFCS